LRGGGKYGKNLPRPMHTPVTYRNCLFQPFLKKIKIKKF